MIPLCINHRLDISLEEGEGSEWITLTLSGDTMAVSHRQEVGTNTTNRAYHRKEAMVIGVRRLLSEAIDRGLISLSPGSWKTTVDPQKAGLSSTDWGF